MNHYLNFCDRKGNGASLTNCKSYSLAEMEPNAGTEATLTKSVTVKFIVYLKYELSLPVY